MTRDNFTYLLCVLLILFTGNAAAQRHAACIPHAYYDSAAEKNIGAYRLRLQHARTQQVSAILIPVAVHILYSKASENLSDETVMNELQVLNDAYNNEHPNSSDIPEEFRQRAANVRISFCLAGKAPDGTPTTGIIHTQTTKDKIGQDPSLFYSAEGGSDAWDTRHVYNIWVAAMDDAVLGFSSSPWDTTLRERDGVVINRKYFGTNAGTQYNLGKTLVHETGHYFGLYHPWRDDEDCNTDDEVDDTPPQSDPYYDCPVYPQYSCGVSNMFMNYMDYVDDRCMKLFTQGQSDRMHACLDLYREELLDNHDMTCYIAGDDQVHSFDLYPNPAQDGVVIRFPYSDFTTYSYTVYDIMGHLLIKGETLGRTDNTVDVSGLIPGLYIIKIGDRYRKFIKQ